MSSLLVYMQQEMLLTYRFISYDLWLVLAMMCIVVTRFSLTHILSLDGIVKSFIFVLGFVCHYDISNQLISVEEDKINKPERPLPAGLCTVEEAQGRYLFFLSTHFLVSLILGQGCWSLLGIVISWFLAARGHRHWITKNVIGGTLTTATVVGGICSSLSIYNEISYIISISLWMGTGLLVELFRDQMGDIREGRITLTQEIGEENTRTICFIYFFSLPLMLCFSPLSLLLHWLLAFHVYFLRDTSSDKRSYRIYCLLFLLLLYTW